MSESKYYFVKYRERHNQEDEWDERNGVSEGVPFLNTDFRDDWYYERIIDFYVEIANVEFEKY